MKYGDLNELDDYASDFLILTVRFNKISFCLI